MVERLRESSLADWFSLTAQFVNHQQTICHIFTSPPSTMTHQMSSRHQLQREPKRCTLILTICSSPSFTFDGRKANYFRERSSTNGKCCCQVDLYYSWSITIWAATHVCSWRMWTWSTAALWLNSPEEWRERSLSSRTQNVFKAGHRVYHASWWHRGNIDHILRIRSVTSNNSTKAEKKRNTWWHYWFTHGRRCIARNWTRPCHPRSDQSGTQPGTSCRPRCKSRSLTACQTLSPAVWTWGKTCMCIGPVVGPNPCSHSGRLRKLLWRGQSCCWWRSLATFWLWRRFDPLSPRRRTRLWRRRWCSRTSCPKSRTSRTFRCSARRQNRSYISRLGAVSNRLTIEVWPNPATESIQPLFSTFLSRGSGQGERLAGL